jgi:microcystin degradation protein MlrC
MHQLAPGLAERSFYMVERRRVAVAQLAQEGNHFTGTLTGLRDFSRRCLLRGDEILTGWGGARTEVPAFLDVLRGAGVEAVPILCAAAESGGPVEQGCFDALLDELARRMARAGPLDGVLLALHGAMVTEALDDPESEIIARVRATLPPGTPIGVSLDLHAHVTPAMLQPDVFLIGYREYPHTDMYQTGARTAALLLERIAGRCHPVMAIAKRPMVLSASAARTVDAPLSEVVAAASAMMAEPPLLHAALFPVQPWLDVPDLGFGVLVCADGDGNAAQQAAERLAEMAWDRRAGFEPDLTPLEEVIRIGLASPGMTLAGDAGDGPTGGAPADRPDVLRALLAAGADRHDRPVLLTLNDPAGVRAAMRAGIGGMFRAELGHAVTPGSRVPVTGRVRLLSDGEYIMRDAAATGMVVQHGPSAVIDIGAIRLVLRSESGREWDTAIYRSVGLDPAAAALVFVKSPGHFRVAFGPLAARTLMADTEGPTCANMRRIPWRRVTRPLWPLDP